MYVGKNIHGNTLVDEVSTPFISKSAGYAELPFRSANMRISIYTLFLTASA